MMKRLLLSLLLVPGTAPAGEDAAQLMEKLRDLRRAETVTAEYQVSIVRPEWERDIVLHVQENQRTERYVAEVHEPRKLEGTQFLKAHDKLWMYMPKLKRRVGISPSMMLEPWMGSDLTNQDLLEADSVLDAYNHEVMGTEKRNGHTVYTIRSTPKDSAAVVWGRLEHRIRDDGVPLKVDYFNREGKLVRRMTFSDPTTYGDRTLPSRWRVTPMPEEGRYTEVRVKDARFNVPLPEGSFANIAGHEMKNDS